MMRYLPFIFISLLLYTWFFYNNQQPEMLSPSAQKKTIVIDFEKIAQHDKQQTDSMLKPILLVKTDNTQISPEPSTKEQVPITNTVTTTVLNNSAEALVFVAKDTTTIAPHSKKEVAVIKAKPEVVNDISQVVIAPSPAVAERKQYHVSIETSPASNAALLKAMFFEQYIYSFLPPLPVKKQVSQAKKTSESAFKIETTNNKHGKKKRSFKKQVPVNPPITMEKTLPEAIAISGNKPHYPQQAKADKQQGTVTVKLIVNMQGKSKSPQIINSSGHAILDNAVLDFIQKERFMPALEGNEKVTREQHYSFKFQLK